jgi:hypothetical protein
VLSPIPTHANPKNGSHKAYNRRESPASRADADDGVVVTVRVAEVPGLTEAGLIEHCGASAGDGLTEQARETEALNPPSGVTLMV